MQFRVRDLLWLMIVVALVCVIEKQGGDYEDAISELESEAAVWRVAYCQCRCEHSIVVNRK